MDSTKLTNCFPGPCQCCVCKGIHCLMFHDGHNHRYRKYDTNDDILRRMLEDLRKANQDEEASAE